MSCNVNTVRSEYTSCISGSAVDIYVPEPEGPICPETAITEGTSAVPPVSEPTPTPSKRRRGTERRIDLHSRCKFTSRCRFTPARKGRRRRTTPPSLQELEVSAVAEREQEKAAANAAASTPSFASGVNIGSAPAPAPATARGRGTDGSIVKAASLPSSFVPAVSRAVPTAGLFPARSSEVVR